MEPKVYVQNVVASARLNHEIDLDAIVKAFPNVEYTPEVFPGLVFRLKSTISSILSFRNGKIVCTGAAYQTREPEATFLIFSNPLMNALITLTMSSSTLNIINYDILTFCYLQNKNQPNF